MRLLNQQHTVLYSLYFPIGTSFNSRVYLLERLHHRWPRGGVIHRLETHGLTMATQVLMLLSD